jgi:uncharacterized protein (UPF0332 family)
MIGFKECVEKRLLVKVIPDTNKALKNIEKARTLLNEAKANLSDGRLNSAVVMTYAAMFDAARAVLFKEGYREKSHYCVARYLEEKHGKKLGEDLINLLDEYRESRHRVLYGAEYYPTTEEASEMMEFAEQFIQKTSELV